MIVANIFKNPKNRFLVQSDTHLTRVLEIAFGENNRRLPSILLRFHCFAMRFLNYVALLFMFILATGLAQPRLINAINVRVLVDTNGDAGEANLSAWSQYNRPSLSSSSASTMSSFEGPASEVRKQKMTNITPNTYTPLVGIGSTDYKTKYSPTNQNFIVDGGVITTAARVGDTTVLQWRIYIPSGTKQVTIAVWAFTGQPDIKGSMRFKALPALTADAITVDAMSHVETKDTLQQLIDGKEVMFFANGGGGGVNLITPAAAPVLVAEGGWLYISVLQIPGMRIQTMQAVIATNEATYRNWFANAKFDADGNPLEVSGSTPVVATANSQQARRPRRVELLHTEDRHPSRLCHSTHCPRPTFVVL